MSLTICLFVLATRGGKEGTYKQLILNITLKDMCFYLEYFVQVNKSDTVISVSFSAFGGTTMICLFSDAISGTKADLHDRSRRESDIERESERDRESMCI